MQQEQIEQLQQLIADNDEHNIDPAVLQQIMIA
jgi:hypothetical protein